jgi:hypothetical protein
MPKATPKKTKHTPILTPEEWEKFLLCINIIDDTVDLPKPESNPETDTTQNE